MQNYWWLTLLLAGFPGTFDLICLLCMQDPQLCLHARWSYVHDTQAVWHTHTHRPWCSLHAYIKFIFSFNHRSLDSLWFYEACPKVYRKLLFSFDSACIFSCLYVLLASSCHLCFRTEKIIQTIGICHSSGASCGYLLLSLVELFRTLRRWLESFMVCHGQAAISA